MRKSPYEQRLENSGAPDTVIKVSQAMRQVAVASNVIDRNQCDADADYYPAEQALTQALTLLDDVKKQLMTAHLNRSDPALSRAITSIMGA